MCDAAKWEAFLQRGTLRPRHRSTRNTAWTNRRHDNRRHVGHLPAVAENFVREVSTSADQKSLALRDLQMTKKVARDIADKDSEKNDADTNSTEDKHASASVSDSAVDRDAILQELDRMETTVSRLERETPDNSTPVGTTGSDDNSNERRAVQIRELRRQIESLRQQLRNQQQ